MRFGRISPRDAESTLWRQLSLGDSRPAAQTLSQEIRDGKAIRYALDGMPARVKEHS
jgi:hypothetical protein